MEDEKQHCVYQTLLDISLSDINPLKTSHSYIVSYFEMLNNAQ